MHKGPHVIGVLTIIMPLICSSSARVLISGKGGCRKTLEPSSHTAHNRTIASGRDSEASVLRGLAVLRPPPFPINFMCVTALSSLMTVSPRASEAKGSLVGVEKELALLAASM